MITISSLACLPRCFFVKLWSLYKPFHCLQVDSTARWDVNGTLESISSIKSCQRSEILVIVSKQKKKLRFFFSLLGNLFIETTTLGYYLFFTKRHIPLQKLFRLKSKLLKLKYILYLALSFPQYLPFHATEIKTQPFNTS